MVINNWFGGQTHFTAPDFLIVALLVVLMVVIGYLTRGRGDTTYDFFLGRRQIPAWAACLSFIATEVSALTLIAVPATAFMENWEYAQFFIGSTMARLTIAYLFIPAFYHYNCTTIYEYLRHRFGPGTQYTGTVFFFITRLLGSGVRLMAASMAVSVLMGWHITPAIVLFTLIGILYISYGGIKAVIWTGVFQASIFILGGLAAITYLLHVIPGGFHGFLQTAGAAGKLRIWDWGPSIQDPLFVKRFFTDPNILWIAILNGFFGSMAAFGTDQDLMQRLLTVETRAKSQRSMVVTTLWSGLVLMIYLTIGACLYAFYAQNPTLPLPQKLDAIYPHFINNVMPVGLRGLMLAVIVMGAIDSPLASLTASFVTDIYRPLIKKDGDEKHYLRISRISICVFALILAVLAYAFSFYTKILWLAFKIGGVTFGSMLGVFLFGFLTKRQSNRANIYGMVLFALINAVLLVLSELKIIPLGWTWLILIGTAGTMSFSYFFGPLLDKDSFKSQANQ